MTPEISCIIYDMDGLLLDTEGIYTEVTQEIVAEYGKVFDWSIKKKDYWTQINSGSTDYS